MGETGIVLVVISLLMFAGVMIMPISVETSVSHPSGYGGVTGALSIPDHIVNNGLVADRQALVTAASGVLIAGCVLMVGGRLPKGPAHAPSDRGAADARANEVTVYVDNTRSPTRRVHANALHAGDFLDIREQDGGAVVAKGTDVIGILSDISMQSIGAKPPFEGRVVMIQRGERPTIKIAVSRQG